MAAFKTGDLVKLKSGGPIMTVKNYRVGGSLACTWFVQTEVKEALFTELQLELAESSDNAKA